MDPTDEHVYAKWMRKAVYATTATTRMTLGDNPPTAPAQTGLNVVLKAGVCRACNNGWLAALEKRVQPWLAPGMEGQHIALAVETQRAVGAWACGKALLIELVMRERRKAFYSPESNLRWLYDHRDDPIPPPGSHVWMAWVDAEFGTTHSLTGFNKAAHAPERPAEPETYLATFSIGYLVFQVAGQDFREPDHLSRTGKPLLELSRPGSFLPYVVSIWPERSDLVVWPPREGFKRGDLPRLGDWEGVIGTRRHLISVPIVK